MTRTLKDQISEAQDLVDLWTNRMVNAEHSAEILTRESIVAQVVAAELVTLTEQATLSEVTQATWAAIAKARTDIAERARGLVDEIVKRRDDAAKKHNELVLEERARGNAIDVPTPGGSTAVDRG